MDITQQILQQSLLVLGIEIPDEKVEILESYINLISFTSMGSVKIMELLVLKERQGEIKRILENGEVQYISKDGILLPF